MHTYLKSAKLTMEFFVRPYTQKTFKLGEGPHWDPRCKSLFIVDILDRTMGTIDPNGRYDLLLQADESLTAVLPAEDDPGSFVVSIGTSIYYINYAIRGEERTLLAHVNKNNVRFNDAKCDSSGRLWIGTMALETSPGVLQPEQGSLYSLEPSGELKERLSKVTLSNGICWSLDDKKLYFIDSVKRAIYSFEFDVQSGHIDNQQVLVDMNNNDQFSLEELPDGMTIDASGNLWVAMFRGSRVVNIDVTSGSVINSIPIPTKFVTSVCFGGEGLKEMFVTTAQLDEPKDDKAGHIFKVTSTNPNFKGFKANFRVKLPK